MALNKKPSPWWAEDNNGPLTPWGAPYPDPLGGFGEHEVEALEMRAERTGPGEGIALTADGRWITPGPAEISATIVMDPSQASAWLHLVTDSATNIRKAPIDYKRDLTIIAPGGKTFRLFGCFPTNIEWNDCKGGPRVIRQTMIEEPVDDGTIQVGDGTGNNVVLNQRIIETQVANDYATVEIVADRLEAVIKPKMPERPGVAMVWE